MRDTIGKLVRVRADGTHEHLGTCFALLKPGFFLTAAHCLVEGDLTNVAVSGAFGGVGQAARLKWARVHPEADLAAFEIQPSPWGAPTPIEDIKTDLLMGEEFYAYGFPREAVPEDPTRETERLFRGYIQRFFYHTSFDERYQYDAIELSILCPKGLSGGPVFTTGGRLELLGVAAEDFESANILDEQHEVDSGGLVTRETLRKVIHYGIAVHAARYKDWIELLA